MVKMVKCKKCEENLVFVNTDKNNGLIGFWDCPNECNWKEWKTISFDEKPKGFKEVNFNPIKE